MNNNFFDDDNLFENGSLVADSGDVLGLTSLMEEEMEVTIPEEFVDDYLVLNGVRENRHLNEEEKESPVNPMDAYKKQYGDFTMYGTSEKYNRKL